MHFRGCSSLKDSSIKLSDNITEIGNYAFSGCALKNFVLPETVIDVGDGLFYGCWDLRSVKLPENMKRIGEEMFLDVDD